MKGAAHHSSWPTLARFSLPAKVLVSAVLTTMAMAMLGAVGQIIVHDIIPTFYGPHQESAHSPQAGDQGIPATGRGDLFADGPVRNEAQEPQSFYETEQFVWMLKWTHIHLFGMSMIFIFVGAAGLFLDLSPKLRAWLIALPFAGVWIDIAGMWLKGFVSPVFFWLHIPGGGVFASVFGFIFCRALWEMWGQSTD